MPNVRAAEEKDSLDIYEWRNDELTRQMSHTTDLVEWEGHSKWFAASLKNESRLLAICEEVESTSKVAVVRFDVVNDRALISINLSPSMRGKGLAKGCLSKSIIFFKSLFPNVSYIDAKIKSFNTASKRSFEAAGFVFIKELDDVLYYEAVS
jgi:RimJ/RimL family protein N-acetyltransferase